jgi:hypothetical protein
MKIYKPQTVSDLQEFYGELLFDMSRYASVHDHLKALSVRMWEGVRAGKVTVLEEIRNYHWSHLGRPTSDLGKMGLSEEDCMQTIANEYGFRRWSEVAHMNIPYDLQFERLVNAILKGRISEVQEELAKNSDLINQKSTYGHKASLLHYTVSNGVELWRQQVPANLPEIVDFLIRSGANTKAKMLVYGGDYTASELLLSSAHPRDAGVLDDLRKLL